MPKKIDTAGLKHFKGKENAMIAGKPESTNTATVAHAVGEYFYWKGVLHIVTAAIAVGGTIQTNTNVKPAVLADDVGALKTAIMHHPIGFTDLAIANALKADGELHMNYTSGQYFYERKTNIALTKGTYKFSLFNLNLSSVGYVVVETSNGLADVVPQKKVDGFYDFTLANDATVIVKMQVSTAVQPDAGYYHCNFAIYDSNFIKADLLMNQSNSFKHHPIGYTDIVDGSAFVASGEISEDYNGVNTYARQTTNVVLSAGNYYVSIYDCNFSSTGYVTLETSIGGQNIVSSKTTEGFYNFTLSETTTVIIRMQIAGATAQAAGLYKLSYAIYKKGFIKEEVKDEIVGEVESRVSTLESIVDTSVGFKSKSQFVEQATLSSGGTMSLTVPNIKQNNRISFCGKIGSSFTSLTIGHGATQPQASGYVVLTGTDLVAYKYDSAPVATNTFTHGLTLSEFVYVTIDVGNDFSATVTVTTSQGATYSNDIYWIGCYGNVTATLDGGSLTNCILSFYCEDYTKDVWVYGDSYVDGWPLIVNQDGANNLLLDGFSGRGATDAYSSFEKDILHGTPKYVLWCMGMNNYDSNSYDSEPTINATWKTETDKMIAFCDENNIEIILSTIPNTPIRNNRAKNAYIRSSGKRYVDISEAVGAETNVNWYTGLLSEDQVHPSLDGRKVIASRMMTCVPEFFK